MNNHLFKYAGVLGNAARLAARSTRSRIPEWFRQMARANQASSITHTNIGHNSTLPNPVLPKNFQQGLPASKRVQYQKQAPTTDRSKIDPSNENADRQLQSALSDPHRGSTGTQAGQVGPGGYEEDAIREIIEGTADWSPLMRQAWGKGASTTGDPTPASGDGNVVGHTGGQEVINSGPFPQISGRPQGENPHAPSFIGSNLVPARQLNSMNGTVNNALSGVAQQAGPVNVMQSQQQSVMNNPLVAAKTMANQANPYFQNIGNALRQQVGLKQANTLAGLARRGGARYADLLRGGFGGRLGKMRGAKKNIHEEFGGIPIDMHGPIKKGIAEEELKVILTRLLTGAGLMSYGASGEDNEKQANIGGLLRRGLRGTGRAAAAPFKFGGQVLHEIGKEGQGMATAMGDPTGVLGYLAGAVGLPVGVVYQIVKEIEEDKKRSE